MSTDRTPPASLLGAQPRWMRRPPPRFGLPVAPTEPIRITPGALSVESHGDASPSTLVVDELVTGDDLAGLDDPDVHQGDAGPFLENEHGNRSCQRPPPAPASELASCP